MALRPPPSRLPARFLALATVSALALAACSSGGSTGSNSAAGSNYPTGTITMVVPFSAGGPTDTVARLVAEPMSKTLGQQIIVQNVEGAGGTLGAGEVAKAKNDGYKILMHHIGMSTAPALYSNLAFKPLESFQTIGLVTEVPMTIISKKAVSYTHLDVYKRQGVGFWMSSCGYFLHRHALTFIISQRQGLAGFDVLGEAV